MPCPGEPFAQENMNYANTQFSFYTEYECTSSGAVEMFAAGAIVAAMAALSMAF